MDRIARTQILIKNFLKILLNQAQWDGMFEIPINITAFTLDNLQQLNASTVSLLTNNKAQ